MCPWLLLLAAGHPACWLLAACADDVAGMQRQLLMCSIYHVHLQHHVHTQP